jgi:hypothetical protein
MALMLLYLKQHYELPLLLGPLFKIALGGDFNFDHERERGPTKQPASSNKLLGKQTLG